MAQKEFREPPRYMVGDIVYSHGFISVVFATSCNDKQIQLQDVKGIKLENNIVTLI